MVVNVVSEAEGFKLRLASAELLHGHLKTS